MTDSKHEKCKVLTKNISKILHEKIKLEKWDFLPCKTVNSHIEIKVYGQTEKRIKVENILKEYFSMKIIEENFINPYTKRPAIIKQYYIDNISILIV